MARTRYRRFSFIFTFFRDLNKIEADITILIDKKLKPIYERTFPHIEFA